MMPLSAFTTWPPRPTVLSFSAILPATTSATVLASLALALATFFFSAGAAAFGGGGTIGPCGMAAAAADAVESTIGPKTSPSQRGACASSTPMRLPSVLMREPTSGMGRPGSSTFQ
jgi:hypothetical protein